MTGIRVSPDGVTLAIAYNPTPHSGSGILTRIRFLDLRNGETRELGVDDLVGLREFSPDGAWFAFSKPRGPEPYFHPDGIFLAPLDGGSIVDATRDIDRDMAGVEWLPDSRSMLVTGTDLTRRVMWHVPLDGPAVRVELDSVDVAIKEVTAEGELILVGSEPHRPSELYRTRVGDWTLERLTAYNDALAEMRLGRVETIDWDGPDGFRQNGVLIYPPDYQEGHRYPLVLQIHGGPMGASTEGWSLVSQAMAAQGPSARHIPSLDRMDRTPFQQGIG